MNALTVEKLRKEYPSFTLDDVSFTLPAGRITGFIGRNGAGKTTTLRALLGLIRTNGGDVRFFGLPFVGNEHAVKQRIGFVSGGVDFYTGKKLRTIAAVTRRFYDAWDDAVYRDLLARFALDESKTPRELSAGMRVKFALALALSHHAELLLLDEPTSGLDPVSRDELQEIFLRLADEGVTILFSTHITSDLDRCADRILYIQNGRIRAEDNIAAFSSAYRLVRLPSGATHDPAVAPLLIGLRRERDGMSALVRAADADKLPFAAEEADLETVMVHLEREGTPQC